MKLDSSVAIMSYQAAKAKEITQDSIQNNNDAKLKEQTDAFEAILLKYMLDTSLKLDDPLYPKQPGADIYQSMYKEQLAHQLSGGFQYSRALFDWLKEQQSSYKKS